MSDSPHVEKHFTEPEVVRDTVIGMADGLTVPFALAAGLSGAIASNHLILAAGLAEIAAGSVAMGLGGYLAARGEAEHYASELKREWREVREIPQIEAKEIQEIFAGYGIAEHESQPIVDAFRRQPERWVDFMMRFELGLEKPNPRRARISAFTIAGAYVVGGLIPLSPYFFHQHPHEALPLSVGVTLVALAVFGYVKGRFTGVRPWRSALQTVVVGALAGGAAYFLARWFGGEAG